MKEQQVANVSRWPHICKPLCSEEWHVSDLHYFPERGARLPADVTLRVGLVELRERFQFEFGEPAEIDPPNECAAHGCGRHWLIPVRGF